MHEKHCCGNVVNKLFDENSVSGVKIPMERFTNGKTPMAIHNNGKTIRM